MNNKEYKKLPKKIKKAIDKKLKEDSGLLTIKEALEYMKKIEKKKKP